MAKLSLEKMRIHAGVWEGRLTAPGKTMPRIELRHMGDLVEGVTAEPIAGEAGNYWLRAPIPAGLLGEGVQTFVITEAGSGEALASFTVVTGQPLEDDIRAEIDLLRAELDLLKQSFRKQFHKLK